MRHQIVSNDQWIAAREQLPIQEKELTRLRDQVSTRRRELPWVQVEKTHVFDGPNGKETLAETSVWSQAARRSGIVATSGQPRL